MECVLEDIMVYYESVGEGRPIIMLHGFSLDHRVMSGCMEPLFAHRKGWQRIYPDLPGMGRTRARDWIAGSDQMLDVVLQFIDAVVPDRSFAVAGESYGGHLARGIVYRRPKSVDGLLLICPVVIADHSKRSLPPHVTLVKDGNLRLDRSDEAEMFRSLAVIQNERHWRRYQDEIVAGARVADWDFLGKLQSEGYSFSFDVNSQPEAFEKPTLILVGRQDSVVGYADAWTMLEDYPRATLAVLDQAGHDLQIEKQHLFETLAGDWLDRLIGPTGPFE
jgi:pimeloyl-ACP methyl ester carboxylesterase